MTEDMALIWQSLAYGGLALGSVFAFLGWLNTGLGR
jgi:hypothetical protein